MDQEAQNSSSELQKKSIPEMISSLIRIISNNFGNPALRKDELDIFKKILEQRGVLLDKQAEIKALIPQIYNAMMEEFAGSIGKTRIKQFVEGYPIDRVLVLSGEALQQVITDMEVSGLQDRLREEQETGQPTYTDETYNHEGLYGPFYDLTFIGFKPSYIDPKGEAFEKAFIEEMMHRFIMPPYGKNWLLNLQRAAKEGRDEEKYGISYFNDPHEQIAKAMVARIFHRLHPDIPSNKIFDAQLDTDAAYQGGKRINEIGWDRIFKGRLRTDHEDDYKIMGPLGELDSVTLKDTCFPFCSMQK